MRGSLEPQSERHVVRGIIPAHAGLTSPFLCPRSVRRDHPRACGAHLRMASHISARLGSSPRMRGSLDVARSVIHLGGIIPAHAGLTCTSCSREIRWWDHPRACGAHSYVVHGGNGMEGSSPRMRGSQANRRHNDIRCWDHPRACGAHAIRSGTMHIGRGSSPRMRGSRLCSRCRDRCEGIIPAHAGLTKPDIGGLCRLRDHPRACGAHEIVPAAAGGTLGSSPRMRGSQGILDEHKVQWGIIPAHAGLTVAAQLELIDERDHPRACGAHEWHVLFRAFAEGSSPRMRGSPSRPRLALVRLGIIPAHAGLTYLSHVNHPPFWDHPRACGAHWHL